MPDCVAGTECYSPARAASPREAIAGAARRTGVDFGYLMAQAEIESGMNPRAEARTSSASGLFQFIDQTWLATMDRHGEALGYGAMARAIETNGGRARITDPTMRDAIMELRFDPTAASLMAGALATDNRAVLQERLGREPDASELYLAHFLGAAGASRFLTTLQASPDSSAVALLPQAAAANRAIFRHPSGAPRSVSEVMAVVRNRVESAMASGNGDVRFAEVAGPAPAAPQSSPPYAHRRRSPIGGAPSLQAPARTPLPSMAETLRTSFSLDGPAAADMPGLAHIRSAYARLGAFGL